MSLTNAQYDEIMRKYDAAQAENRYIQESHIKEVYAKIPEFSALDKELAELSLSLIKNKPDGVLSTAEIMTKKASEVEQAKKALLVRHGYPINYLEMGYSCPDCKDTGYIGRKQCHCLKAEILKVLYKQSNIDYVLNKENFSTLSTDYYLDSELDQMNSIIDKCKNYVKDFDEKGGSILFYGDSGTGKTFLTNCIAKELLDSNHSVIYFTSFQLFDTLSKYVFRSGEVSEDIQSIHEDIFSCDLLIIDDLGTETTNSFVVSQLFLIINERALRDKATIISTNLSMEDIDERYTERIFSRIFGGYILIHPVIQDLRIKLKKINNRK